MGLQLKPTHLKRLVAILESGEYETPEDMAKALVADLTDARSEDRNYMIVIQTDANEQPVYAGYGPYATFNAARKAIETGKVSFLNYAKVAVVTTWTPEHAEANYERHKGDADKWERVQ